VGKESGNAKKVVWSAWYRQQGGAKLQLRKSGVQAHLGLRECLLEAGGRPVGGRGEGGGRKKLQVNSRVGRCVMHKEVGEGGVGLHPGLGEGLLQAMDLMIEGSEKVRTGGACV
jgi:hypothetical protein